MLPKLYHYQALVTKVYDGDTCTVDIDLGLGVWLRGQTLRLYGINTPEMRGPSKPQGIISRDFVRRKVLGKTITIQTVKDKKGKYGRYLAVLFMGHENLNALLVQHGLAVEYFP